MPPYFVDSWYLIARANRFDASHAAASRLQRALASHALVTHYGVLAEVLNFFCQYGRETRTRAARMVRRVALEFATILPADRSLFSRALDLYERRPDKGYSLTDCMSMVVMRDRGITGVLTNDHHFTQEGFTVLSDAP